MMNTLGSTTLESRRQTAKVVMMYRIVDINARSVLIPAGVHSRGYANRYIVSFTTVNVHQISFSPTGIRLWNGLQEQVVPSPSIDVFMTRMGELYK
ncbi:hypothetical protein DPMN_190343 [Dreissena polymorpha]|uniref:Uncharacterized protein n=1 Tax=Dreissena polymorpha TaxID=45954 RepID=A0A9D4DWM7_DREPO|nr:hypothetical protein DPMN_190343 [Dreissena polymorpha]